MTKGKPPKIKHQQQAAPRIVPGHSAPEQPLSVSLKYWHTGSQCISEWQKSELERLRKAVDKMQALTPSALRNDQGLRWKPHKGKVAPGFSRPTNLSRDIPLCEVRIDNKGRLHGALFDGTFFLVWLDRSHEVFPEKA